MTRYFTIGMAGHIDHGKTTLTKALTGVNTDHLKEEIARSISIEPGYAPFIQEDGLIASIIDVPGHERFIRQMIAGVAGIDLVILVIAANEGIMPQTTEHLHILSLLGIQNGVIVITKMDTVEQELLDLVSEDIKEQRATTFLAEAPIYCVDSKSNKGIAELKDALREKLLQLPKKENTNPFRLPIDQVFTVKGQGVVVRGTVYDGKVNEGEQLTILPQNTKVRVRQIQSHHQKVKSVVSGQRAALNLSGISHEEISRGHVLVAKDHYTLSRRINITFSPLPTLKYKVTQRQPVKVHIGTSEVMGRIIFFDRNDIGLNKTEEILCQLELDDDIIVTRGDRFIVRKPSPAETIGGGWVIEPNAQKQRFGKQTIEELQLKKAGSPSERTTALLTASGALTKADILKQTSLTEAEWLHIQEELIALDDNTFTLTMTFEHVQRTILQQLKTYHEQYPMRIGMDKAELTSQLAHHLPNIVDKALQTLENEQRITMTNQFVSLQTFSPTYPPQWKTKLERAERELNKQGLEVEKWGDILAREQIPEPIGRELYHYLIALEKAYRLDEERLISSRAVEQALTALRTGTGEANFTLQTARDILQLTRKNLVPLLELFDALGATKRIGNERTWIKKDVPS